MSVALISEARSLTNTCTRIVEAKYPELGTVGSIGGLNLKRFALLKSQYELASRCAASVDQFFNEVFLTDMTQPPDLQKSMATQLIVSSARSTRKIRSPR